MTHQLTIGVALCILSLGLVAETVQQTASLNAQVTNSATDTSLQSLFRYKSNLLSGRAEKEPLEKILTELSKAVRLEFVLKYKPEADEVVSFRIEGKVLADGIKEILRNYNYIFIPAANVEDVSKLILLGQVYANTQSPASIAVSIQEEEIQEEEIQVVNSKLEKKPAGPWDLDEFQKLNFASKEIAQYGEDSMTPEQREALEALEREELEQRMARAMDALETDYSGIKEAAIGELTGVDSPEATNALLNTALNGKDKGLQQIAAEALWRHAADLEYKNLEANQALQTLADKGDPTTNEYAQNALEDAKRYAKNGGDAGE